MSERISLTVEERTLLHLLSYSRFLNHWEVPFHLTQEGIAESIGIARCNVSRAMKKILQKGLVQERTAHVKGVARKRKVYFLTHDGELMANDLKGNVGDTILRVQMSDGSQRIVEMRASSASQSGSSRGSGAYSPMIAFVKPAASNAGFHCSMPALTYGFHFAGTPRPT